MPKTQTVLEVLVASPGDVSDERAILEEVIRELNITWSDTLGVRLDLLRWETHVTPGVGTDAQDVVNQQIGDKYDIFIGIMWARFGSPTNRAESGTQEEFERAYQRIRDDRASLEIMFYFKDTPIPPSQLDASQLSKVHEFQRRLRDCGTLYHSFTSVDEFRTNARIHLSKAVQRWLNRVRSGAVAPKTIEAETSKPLTDLATFADPDDDEGLLDLIERAEDSIERNREVMQRMTSTTEMLGKKFQERTADANKISSAGGTPNLKAAKRVSNNAAADLEEFVARMDVDVPVFADSLADAMDAFAKAATIASEINPDEKDDLQSVLEAVQGYREAMDESGDHVKEFRTVVSQLPRMTTAFNRARRRAIAVLDDLLARFEAGDRQLSEVEQLLKELIGKTNGDTIAH